MFSLLIVCVFGHLSASAPMHSKMDIFQGPAQRIETRISNLEDAIKLAHKQLRNDMLSIYSNLEKQIKLLHVKEQKRGTHDVGDIKDLGEQKDGRYKEIKTRIHDFEKDKGLQEDIIDAVKSISSAVSLLSDVIKQTVDGQNSMKQTWAEIKATQTFIRQTAEKNQDSIISLGFTVGAFENALTDRLNGTCREGILASENRLTTKIDNTINQIQNVSVLSSNSLEEVIEIVKQVKNQCKAHDDVQQSWNLKLQHNLDSIRTSLNDTVNICLPNVGGMRTTHAPTTSATTGPVVHSTCRNGAATSGVYKIKTPNTSVFEVYCDMETDGGGWLVFQRRKDGSVDFYRDWQEYKEGFGNVSGEFWLGNDIISELTSSAPHELRIDLLYWNGTTRYAKYSTFSIGPESDKYRLHISGYSGTVIDSMASDYNLNNRVFSTKDRDTVNGCAALRQGAWWYGYCSYSNLNGHYYASEAEYEGNKGIYWYYISLKGSEMKIRAK